VRNFLGRLDDVVGMEMVSDVPFGAFLSGGLDSSTIVALMTRHNSKVRTFSVGFGEGGYSELAYANVVAKHFGTQHHELTVGFDDIVRTCRSSWATATRRSRSLRTSRSTCSPRKPRAP
jgi:Asparagine synthase (glutamine-hydrolyzing)